MEKLPEKKILGIISIIIGVVALVLSWVPFINNFAAIVAVIGLVFGVVGLFLNRKHKKIFSWIGVVLSVLALAVVLMTQSMYSNAIDKATEAPQAEPASNAKASSTASSSSKTTKKNTIEVNYEKYEVKDSKTYKVNYSDTSWAGTNVTVNSVTVYKLAKAYKYDSANDGNFDVNGFVQINMSVLPTRDISIYPTQGTLVLDNGEQHEADSDESWDGDIAASATKTGNITVPVSSLDSSSSIGSLRFKFDGNYETDDYDDENSDHDYDMSINLNN